MEDKSDNVRYLRAELIDVIDYPDGSRSVMIFSVDEWGDYVLPIVIDPSIALSIRKVMDGVPFPRPLTHDVMVAILERFDITVEKVTIDGMIDGVYVSTITLRDNRSNSVVHIDSRPSDAVAIAIRVNAPIYVASHLRKYAEPYSLYERLIGLSRRRQRW